MREQTGCPADVCRRAARNRTRSCVAMCTFSCVLALYCHLTLEIVATRYGLDGPGIKSRWGRDFPHPSRPVLGPTQPLIEWVPGLFARGKEPGCGVNHPPPSTAEVKERAELYFYARRAFVVCSRANFINCKFTS